MDAVLVEHRGHLAGDHPGTREVDVGCVVGCVVVGGGGDAAGGGRRRHDPRLLADVLHRRGARVRGVVDAGDHRDVPAPVRQALLLDQAVRDVDAEAVDPALAPEPQHVVELGAHLRVLPVEVRLGGVEEVQVPLPGVPVGLGDSGPGGAAEDGLPVVRRLRPALAAAVAEEVPRPLGRAGTGGQRGLEPRVLVRGVVGHQVHDDPHPQFVGASDQRVGVLQGAEERVDVAVVGDVVPGVLLRGPVERREPDGVHPERGQVVQAGDDAGQVADAVAVAVGERARVDLVNDGGAPPLVGGERLVDRGVHGWCPFPKAGTRWSG